MALLCFALAGCAHGDPPVVVAPATQPASRPQAEAPPAPHREAILAQATRMHDLLRAGKIEAFVSYMDPNVVRMAGSREVIVTGTRHIFKAMGSRIKKVELGPVSAVVVEGPTLAAFVEVLMTYQLPAGRVLQKTYLVASSRNGGKTWKFMSSQCKAAQEQATRRWYPKLMQKVSPPKCWAKKDAEPAKPATSAVR